MLWSAAILSGSLESVSLERNAIVRMEPVCQVAMPNLKDAARAQFIAGTFLLRVSTSLWFSFQGRDFAAGFPPTFRVTVQFPASFKPGH